MQPTIICIKKYIDELDIAYQDYSHDFIKQFGFECFWYTDVIDEIIYKYDDMLLKEEFNEKEKEDFKLFFTTKYPEINCANCIHKHIYKLTEKCDDETYIKK
jgi:hypothetical protein